MERMPQSVESYTRQRIESLHKRLSALQDEIAARLEVANDTQREIEELRAFLRRPVRQRTFRWKEPARR